MWKPQNPKTPKPQNPVSDKFIEFEVLRNIRDGIALSKFWLLKSAMDACWWGEGHRWLLRTWPTLARYWRPGGSANFAGMLKGFSWMLWSFAALSWCWCKETVCGLTCCPLIGTGTSWQLSEVSLWPSWESLTRRLGCASWVVCPPSGSARWRIEVRTGQRSLLHRRLWAIVRAVSVESQLRWQGFLSHWSTNLPPSA